ncbi:MAG: MdtA/MuxA family multidrug efflux RND transporter periplasmic adaptor subunit [Desulfovibrio sp.]|nr:MdtA/MuxA family multidrug efflux RND transporter periplasmic adaptor subunit [Desulfovibrio sp.]
MSASPKRSSCIGRLFWLSLILIAAIALWRLFFAGGGSRGMMGDAAPVRTAVAAAQNVPHFLSGLGTATPSSDVLVKSRVDGQLMALHFTEGQRVAAGDLLAEIDPRPFKAALAEAQGKLAIDLALLKNSRLDLGRYARLAGKDFVARQTYDNQVTLVAQHEGAVAADRANVETARLQLEYSRITAPVGGVTGLRKVDVGNQVKSSDSEGIVRITEISPCDVLFTLPEADIPLVAAALARQNGQAASVPVQAWDREQKTVLARGRLLSMDNQIDASTGTVRLKARFDNPDGLLYPNQFVNARVRVRVLENAVTIPVAALQLGVNGSYVYVLTPDSEKTSDSDRGNRPPRGSAKGARPAPGGKVGRPAGDELTGVVHRREVTAGVTAGRLVVVEKGLSAGETVIVDGLDRLRDGSRVRVAATVETPAAEALE